MDKLNELPTGALREDKTNKPQLSLIPMEPIFRVARHMQNSNKPIGKHEPHNWKKGINISELCDSALRHLYQYLNGDTDEDHIAACVSNLIMSMWFEENKPELQLEHRKKENRVDIIIKNIYHELKKGISFAYTDNIGTPTPTNTPKRKDTYTPSTGEVCYNCEDDCVECENFNI